MRHFNKFFSKLSVFEVLNQLISLDSFLSTVIHCKNNADSFPFLSFLSFLTFLSVFLLCFLLYKYNYALYTIYQHRPINHGLVTPFISYRVTLNSRKTQDLFEISLFGNRTNSALSPMLGFIDKFVMFVLLLVRHMFFWVIIILHCCLEGWVI